MRPRLAVVVFGVLGLSGTALAAAAGRPAGGVYGARLPGCNALFDDDGCATCLAEKPAAGDRCDLTEVAACLTRLQADVEWFEQLLVKSKAGLVERAEQQARVLELLERIRTGVAQGSAGAAEIADLVEKLHEAVAGPQSGEDDGGTPTPRTESGSPQWRQDVRTSWLPLLQRAEQRLAALQESVGGEAPTSREAIQSDLQAVSDALWEAAIAAGAVPRAPAPSDGAAGSWQLLLPKSGVQACSQAQMRVVIGDDKNAYLFAAYHAYHTLKAKLKSLKNQRNASADFDDVERQRLLVQALMHRVLRREGFDQPVMGVLAGGVGFTRAPDEGGQSAAQGAQSLVVRFESKHTPIGRLDASLLGKFGVQPSFDLLRPDDPSKFSLGVTTAQTGPNEFEREVRQQSVTRLICPAADSADKDCRAAAPPDLAAQYANSFVWDAGLRAGRDIFGFGELSGFGRYGQTHGLKDFTAVKNADGDPVAATLVSTGSDSRWYQEWGGRFVIYPQRANHEAHGFAALTPVLEAEGGWRVDRRFQNRSKDLPVDMFGEHPERRWFMRFALNGLPVLGGADAVVRMSFAVEWEGKRGAKGLPSGTKIYVQGNLDLNKLLASK